MFVRSFNPAQCGTGRPFVDPEGPARPYPSEKCRTTLSAKQSCDNIVLFADLFPGKAPVLWKGFAVCIYPDHSFDCVQQVFEEITNTLCVHRCYPYDTTFPPRTDPTERPE